MNGGLIQTKLTVPQLRPSLVQRPQLFARLDEGAGGKLTLVSAPAGYGKSTLVCAWIHITKTEKPSSQFCWLSLDADDNDPVRFLTYFATALHGVNDRLGTGALEMLQAPQPPPVDALATVLIDAIVVADIEFTVVLDDYQNISARVIHDALAFLLEYQPPQMHLLLLTREDPSLPLSRLRAGGQMTEIRFADLRFDKEDTAVFLNDIMHLNLSEDEIAALEERTEGWIAGLQLAALSMRGLDDTHSFVQSFMGSSRYVLDYLIEEVFQRQTRDVKGFLLQTAVLDRLSAPLCDAVTGRDDSKEVLLQLEQANLFVIALDESRQWYRYHQLFGDLLRHRSRRQGVAARESHERASHWYEANDFPAEAIKHALAAESWPHAATLVENNSTQMLRRGQIASLLRLVRALPNEFVFSRPELCANFAWALALSREVDEAERYVQILLPMAEGRPVFLAGLLTLQAHIARTRHDTSQTIAYSQRALSLLPDDDFNARSILGVNLGVAYLYNSDLVKAESVWMEAAQNAQRAKNYHAAVMALSFAGQAQAAWGNLHDAASLQRQAIQLGEDNRALPATGRARVNLAALLYEWNDLETAGALLLSALELSKRTGDIAVEWDAYRTLALVLQAQGKNGEAVEAIERAHDAARDGDAPANLRLANMIVHLQIALKQNDLAVATRCYRTSQSLDQDGVSWRSDLLVNAGCLFSQPGLSWARHLLARGEDQAAGKLLADCYETAVEAALPHDQINARVWQALAAAGNESALTFLTEAVVQAQSEGFVRSFIDAGAALRPLLQDVVSLKVAPVYVGKLVVALDAEIDARTLDQMTQFPSIPTQPLIEPLSDRELQIMQLLAGRRTNAEIALALTVSVNTVKTHLRHVYEKLGVHDRRTAVVRAIELNLIGE